MGNQSSVAMIIENRENNSVNGGFGLVTSYPHDDITKWKRFPRYCPLWGESTGRRWIPLTKYQ